MFPKAGKQAPVFVLRNALAGLHAHEVFSFPHHKDRSFTRDLWKRDSSKSFGCSSVAKKIRRAEVKVKHVVLSSSGQENSPSSLSAFCYLQPLPISVQI